MAYPHLGNHWNFLLLVPYFRQKEGQTAFFNIKVAFVSAIGRQQ